MQIACHILTEKVFWHQGTIKQMFSHPMQIVRLLGKEIVALKAHSHLRAASCLQEGSNLQEERLGEQQRPEEKA